MLLVAREDCGEHEHARMRTAVRCKHADDSLQYAHFRPIHLPKLERSEIESALHWAREAVLLQHLQCHHISDTHKGSTMTWHARCSCRRPSSHSACARRRCSSSQLSSEPSEMSDALETYDVTDDVRAAAGRAAIAGSV